MTPKHSVRADKPDIFWHVDTTIIKLLDQTKIYLHAVIDNFSRKILAWRVCERFEFANTVAILREAALTAVSADKTPTVVVDAGVENLSAGVDELIESGWLHRVVALKDVTFSNSMIEAWWRTLKHQWLYLNTLDSAQAVQRLVAFYVTEHNTHIPHSAFRGETRTRCTTDAAPISLKNCRWLKNRLEPTASMPIKRAPVGFVKLTRGTKIWRR